MTDNVGFGGHDDDANVAPGTMKAAKVLLHLYSGEIDIDRLGKILEQDASRRMAVVEAIDRTELIELNPSWSNERPLPDVVAVTAVNPADAGIVETARMLLALYNDGLADPLPDRIDGG